MDSEDALERDPCSYSVPLLHSYRRAFQLWNKQHPTQVTTFKYIPHPHFKLALSPIQREGHTASRQ